ncbi:MULTISPECIES: MtrB/PioB family decaheme-associated outer membrane protein [unclassified Wenzhouxiangella]|uniref:MtrB/PioB family decaheme-associated outer membrane protein n=1 Tax=unclassified Wenzhouxiangella TaxID=2613841 RepID=UPI000E329175|nr:MULTISPECIES: MtrB/PioB family decaheme-associated outer membrane protein [unclassified Wenzhouxiangella]RFF28049.1 MtrB/PioB family decaheme-associated outer membrane protein [Wenzhouxiangella sp. 15181]RFP68635.1 MtrB/PioB family decaheme-associated outer membrane protein [Wenzhouxiangella sp. 15190]
MTASQRHRRFQVRAVAFIGFLLMGMSVSGQDRATSQEEEESESTGPDTSEWICEDCPFVYGLSGSVLLGAGYVSDDLFDFGNYRGLEQEGVYGAAGVDLRYRTEDARYLDLYGERLGLDSRTLSVEGGRQGSYSVSLDYDETPYLDTSDTRTIFEGAGTANQTLPADWVRGGTTDEMTALAGSLHGVDIRHKRKTLGLALEVNRKSPWRYRVDVQQTRKEGNLIRGGSFIFRAAELASPVDYETTRVEAAVGYVRDRWQLEAAYHLSRFDNDNRSVRWQNPFAGINGADLGELAQPPENQFHQFMLSGSWRYSKWLMLSGHVAVGRSEQDEQFLAPTLNTSLANPSLPRSDLDGRVDTQIANLRATSNLTDRLRAKLQFRYDERDNKTPVDSFVQVVSDTFVMDERAYEPYSYERTSMNATLDYRVASDLKVTASATHKGMERSLQEVENTDTNLYSFKIRATPVSRLNVNVKASREERNNDLDPARLGPQVNPSLRRFHFAEKDRDALRFVADYALRENVAASLFAEFADEEFSDTEIGLSDGRARSYGLDVSATFSSDITAHAFVAFESLDATILGADNIEDAPWEARQSDDFRTAGIGLNFGDLPGKWVEGRLDFTYASADGDIEVQKRGSAPPFPTLETSRMTLEASAERELGERLNLRFGYLVGKLTEDDFFRDDVAPDTVPTLLSLGQRPLDGTVHVFNVMLRYRFSAD